LPNGNTLITEGAPGRVFEVTSDREIVWEYHVTYFSQAARPTNSVYRACRLPAEESVTPPALADSRVPYGPNARTGP
jgi:hypothetical protein